MTVSEQIIQVLNVLCAKFGLVIDWTSENVIPYISVLFEKLVKYEIWTSVAWMVFALVAIAITAIVFVRARKAEVFEDDFFGPLVVIFLIVGFLVFISVVICQTMDIIRCVTFPEMFVFEYVQQLISSGS